MVEGLWWCGWWNTGGRCSGLVPPTAGSGRVSIWVLEVDSPMSRCVCGVLGVCFWHLFCYIMKKRWNILLIQFYSYSQLTADSIVQKLVLNFCIHMWIKIHTKEVIIIDTVPTCRAGSQYSILLSIEISQVRSKLNSISIQKKKGLFVWMWSNRALQAFYNWMWQLATAAKASSYIQPTVVKSRVVYLRESVKNKALTITYQYQYHVEVTGLGTVTTTVF